MRASVLLTFIQFAISYSLKDPPRKDDAIVPSAPSAAAPESLPTATPAKGSGKEARAHPPVAEQVPPLVAEQPPGTSVTISGPLGMPSAVAPEAVMLLPTATPANSSIQEVRSARPERAPEREDGMEADALEPEVAVPPKLGSLAQLRKEPAALAQLRQETVPAPAEPAAAQEAAAAPEAAAATVSKSTSKSISKSSKTTTSKVKARLAQDGKENADPDTITVTTPKEKARTEAKFNSFVTIVFWMGAGLVLLVLIFVAVCFNKDLLRPRYRRNRQGFEVGKGGGAPSQSGWGVDTGKGWGY